MFSLCMSDRSMLFSYVVFDIHVFLMFSFLHCAIKCSLFSKYINHNIINIHVLLAKSPISLRTYYSIFFMSEKAPAKSMILLRGHVRFGLRIMHMS